MPYSIETKDGILIENIPDNVSPDDPSIKRRVDAIRAQNNMEPPKSVTIPEPTAPEPVVSFGQQVRDIPRQLGLTARYGIEGTLGAADVLGAPIRMLTEQILGREVQPAGPSIANLLNLPQPQTPTERVVGDISRATAGAGVPVGIGQLVQPARAALSQAPQGAVSRLLDRTGISDVLSQMRMRQTVTQQPQGAISRILEPIRQTGPAIAQTLANQPALQAAVSAAGGATAGSVREAGGGPIEQTVAGLGASLLTGLGAPSAVSMAQRGGEALLRATRPAPPQVNIDLIIENALRPSGTKLSELSPSLRESLRGDISKATQLGELSAPAIGRLVDYRLTGATPTRATLTLNPGEVTRQKFLAKQGANIDDPAAQRLANIENQNNQVLLGKMNTLGAESAIDFADASRQLIGKLNSFANGKQAVIRDLYSKAKASGGRSALLDNFKFANSVGDALDSANLGSFLPREFKRTLNQISTGKIPLTVDVAEQIKTQLATAQRSASDGNVRAALGTMRDALDNTPLETNQKLGRDAIDAFNAARTANREFKQLQDQNPFLKKVIEGVEPDKFFEQQIINQPASQVKKLLQFVEVNDRELIKNQLVAYIKDKATGGQADDVARLSGIRMTQALKSIGKDKLEAIFTKEELAQLRAVANVARYEQVLPVGSAVNTSNTAAAAAGMLDRLSRSTVLGRIPLGTELVGRPLQNIMIGTQAQRAAQVPSALTIEQLRRGEGFNRVPLGLLFQERE
jgi:hypothetical protein